MQEAQSQSLIWELAPTCATKTQCGQIKKNSFFKNRSIMMAQWVKNLPTMQERRCGFDPWVRKIPWRRKWQPTTVFLPGRIPGTKEPGGLQFLGSQSQTQLSD